MLRKTKKSIVMITLVIMLMGTLLTGCGNTTPTTTPTPEAQSQQPAELTGQALKDAVKAEGQIVSYGMPNEWANLGELWDNFTKEYGITHADTDMSSAEEISKFDAEKNSPVADIGDIGMTFGSVAIDRDVVQPYKGPNWGDVPTWAKDPNGYWTGEYVGTIAFLVNKNLVKEVPHSWADLLKPEYKNSVVVGDVQKAAQSQAAVLAAAYANGGDEKNIQPGIDYFAKLAKAGNVKQIDNTYNMFEKGEVPIGILWDFNALGYRAKLDDPQNYEVVIPSDGSVASAYVSIINKTAPHPNAAKAFQDYLLSDEGQILYAKGYARPIRDNVVIPEDIAKNMVPKEQYAAARPIQDFAAWGETAKQIPDLWRNNVMVNQ